MNDNYFQAYGEIVIRRGHLTTDNILQPYLTRAVFGRENDRIQIASFLFVSDERYRKNYQTVRPNKVTF